MNYCETGFPSNKFAAEILSKIHAQTRNLSISQHFSPVTNHYQTRRREKGSGTEKQCTAEADHYDEKGRVKGSAKGRTWQNITFAYTHIFRAEKVEKMNEK